MNYLIIEISGSNLSNLKIVGRAYTKTKAYKLRDAYKGEFPSLTYRIALLK